MSWSEIIRESLQRIAPHVVWVVLALGISTLVAFIREPLSRLLREAREQLRVQRGRLLARSAIRLGRKFRRFWLARQSEPARTVAGALDRLAEALPGVGRKSLGRVAALQAELQKQLGILEALGLQPPASKPGAKDVAFAPPPAGSWGKLLLLGFIAGLTGAANSFLLNEFFQGVLTSDPLFPSAFPDLHVSHIFAVLIFMMEVAIGFALHHFAEEHRDESPARKLLAFAPWLVLAGLVCLEGWAYALLSYQIDIPERLNLSPDSGLYTFARYFLALFGAGLTLLLSSLGYLLGKEVDKLHAGREARQHERLLQRYGSVISEGPDQVERTARALAGLRTAAQGFQLDLVLRFKREIEATSRSENLQGAVRDALSEILESAGQVEAKVRWLHRRENGERRPVRTRAQALADMCLFAVALALLLGVSLVSAEYIAAFVRGVQGGRASAASFALAAGLVMTGFALSAGNVARLAWGNGRVRRVGALALLLLASGGLMAIAVANHTLGTSTPLNLLFGLLHAGILVMLGGAADAALVNSLHLLRLVGLYLERAVVSLGALFLWLPRALLAVLDWLVRLVAVFGQLVVRPRPAVRYGVVEVPPGARVPREIKTPARRFTDKVYQPSPRSERA